MSGSPAEVDALDGESMDRLLRIGGAAFVVEMIDLFLENAPRRLEAARSGLAAGDFPAVYRAAHSLKSTAGNLGAQTLQRTAERLEDRAAVGDQDAVVPLLEELHRRFGSARTALETARDRHAAMIGNRTSGA